jgi:hypothetical protein
MLPGGGDGMKQTIRAVSYIQGEDGAVPTDALTAAERKDLSRWLRMTWLSELCRGRAKVTWAKKKDPAR